jgi:Ca-activated chloride channel family protein
VVFLLDRSGSMSGWKMVAARRALARMVETLTERDLFSILAFDDRVETPRHFEGERLVPATMARRSQAADFLLEIEARGGTEMLYPLEQAVAELNKQRGGDRILVLITDGQVGNEDQILQRLGKKLSELRIYTLGIDTAVNEAFLRRLSMLGGGSCDLVESEARLEGMMDKVQRRIGTAVLTGLGIDGANLEIETLVPARLPDLFTGVPLVLTGRYRGVAERSITVKGTDAAGRPWTQTLQGRTSRNAAIVNVWARGYLRTMEDAYVTREGDPRLLEKQIVEVSLMYGALCRFTAFVAVDRAEVVNQGGAQHRIVQPVEAPAGWEMFEKRPQVRKMLRAKAKLSAPMASATPDVLGSVDSYLMEFDGETAGNKPAAPGVPPAPRSSASYGFGMKPMGRSDSVPASEVDLTAYRRRAAEKLTQMVEREQAADFDREAELGVFRLWLDDLLEDLRSVGAADVMALTALKKQLAGDWTDTALLWQDAICVLRAFAGGSAHKKSRKRLGFWK